MWERDEAMKGAAPVVKVLRGLKADGKLDAIGWAGSIRRMKPQVHDVDLVASIPEGVNQVEVANKIRQALGNTPVGTSGQEKALRIFLPINGREEPLQIDLLLVPKASWGAAWMHMTGPAELNIANRIKARNKGWKLNQYGLYDADGKNLASATEEEIMTLLGLEYTRPEERG